MAKTLASIVVLGVLMIGTSAAPAGTTGTLALSHAILTGPVNQAAGPVPLGVADVKRRGTDATIVAVSIMVPRALEAAAALEREGISAEVVDVRTLVPLDKATILTSVASDLDAGERDGRATLAFRIRRGGPA